MALEAVQDFPEYKYVNDHHGEDGIDKGRDGDVIHWSDTEWQGSRDFQDDMRVVVDTFEIRGRAFTVTARPDRRDRGSGANFNISPDDGGRVPTEFERSMYSVSDVEDAIDSRIENVAEEEAQVEGDEVVEELGNGWAIVDEGGTGDYYAAGRKDGRTVHLDRDGEVIERKHYFVSKESVREAYRAWLGEPEEPEPTDEVIEELGLGWVLIEDADTGEYAGVGQDNGTRLYLDNGGETTESERLFPSKERVREAFRAWKRQQQGMIQIEELGLGWAIFETADLEFIVAADETTYLDGDGKIVSDEWHFETKEQARNAFTTWRDDRHDSISEARSEMNEVMRQRADEVDEILGESRGGDGEVITESQTVEGDTQVVEGETTTETVAGGAADMFDSATDTATDAAETARSSVGEFEPRQIPVPVLGAVLLIAVWRFLR